MRVPVAVTHSASPGTFWKKTKPLVRPRPWCGPVSSRRTYTIWVPEDGLAGLQVRVGMFGKAPAGSLKLKVKSARSGGNVEREAEWSLRECVEKVHLNSWIYLREQPSDHLRSGVTRQFPYELQRRSTQPGFGAPQRVGSQRNSLLRVGEDHSP